jgi:hypothetical protein
MFDIDHVKDGTEGMASELVEQLSRPAEQDHYSFHNTTDQTLDMVERVRNGLPPRTPAVDPGIIMNLLPEALLYKPRSKWTARGNKDRML